MDNKCEGISDEHEDYLYQCIKLKDESFKVTIQQRRQVQIWSHQHRGKLSVIPLNMFEWFVYCINKEKKIQETERWTALKGIAENGNKIHKAVVTLHSMIPLVKEQTTQAGTTIEKLTFSSTP